MQMAWLFDYPDFNYPDFNYPDTLCIVLCKNVTFDLRIYRVKHYCNLSMLSPLFCMLMENLL